MATSENYTKDFPVSWEELHRNGKALAWKLLNKGPLEEGNYCCYARRYGSCLYCRT